VQPRHSQIHVFQAQLGQELLAQILAHHSRMVLLLGRGLRLARRVQSNQPVQEPVLELQLVQVLVQELELQLAQVLARQLALVQHILQAQVLVQELELQLAQVLARQMALVQHSLQAQVLAQELELHLFQVLAQQLVQVLAQLPVVALERHKKLLQVLEQA